MTSLYQTSLFAPESDWVAPETLPDLDRHVVLGIDTETKDPNLRRSGSGWPTGQAHITGFCVATEEDKYYFPIRHGNGGPSDGNLDPVKIKEWVSYYMRKPNVAKVFHTAVYDLGMLSAEGIEVHGEIHDVGAMAALLDEHRRSYGLDNLGKDYLGIRKNEWLLNRAAQEFGLDPKADMWKLHAKYVGPYGEDDPWVTLKLFEHFKPKIDEENLNQIYDLERGIIPILVEMKRKGVLVDQDAVASAEVELNSKKKEIEEELRKKLGWKSARHDPRQGHQG